MDLDYSLYARTVSQFSNSKKCTENQKTKLALYEKTKIPKTIEKEERQLDKATILEISTDLLKQRKELIEKYNSDKSFDI